LATTREARIHIRLKPEVAEVWSKLGRPERVKLGEVLSALNHAVHQAEDARSTHRPSRGCETVLTFQASHS
jgi:hypothetical protein